MATKVGRSSTVVTSKATQTDHNVASDSTSSGVEAIWQQAYQTFVDTYEKEFESYEALSQIVEELCSLLVKSEGIRAQVSSRVKGKQSLETKVAKAMIGSMGEDNMTPSLRQVSSEEEALKILRGVIRDRAGVRVLVYFPNDVSRAATAVQSCEDLEYVDAVVSFTKSRQDARAMDREQQKRQEKPLNYADGPWETQTAAVAIEEITHRWKHSGYRAAHIHVNLTVDTSIDSTYLTAADVRTMFRNKHTIKIPGSSERVSSVSALHPRLSKTPFHSFEDKEVEIQITTIVMHAWSQVEHDIIYKIPPGMLHSRSVNHMLDGINGLSITTEIMLEELERSLGEVQAALIHQDKQNFRSTTDLQKWLKLAYLRDTNPLYWEVNPRGTEVLFMILSHEPFNDPCPHQLKLCLMPPKHLELGLDGSHKYDISLLLLRALCASQQVEFVRPGFTLTARQTNSLWVIKQFTIAIAVEFMIVFEGRELTQTRLEAIYPSTDLQFMKTVFKDRKLGAVDATTRARLDLHADKFLSAKLCAAHDLAVILSRSGWLPLLRSSKLSPTSKDYSFANEAEFADFWNSLSSEHSRGEGFSIIADIADHIKEDCDRSKAPGEVCEFSFPDGLSGNTIHRAIKFHQSLRFSYCFRAKTWLHS